MSSYDHYKHHISKFENEINDLISLVKRYQSNQFSSENLSGSEKASELQTTIGKLIKNLEDLKEECEAAKNNLERD